MLCNKGEKERQRCNLAGMLGVDYAYVSQVLGTSMVEGVPQNQELSL
jgi:hypothetical protein